MSITLKDHHFNRIFSCCEGLVYHIEDIAHYLATFRNIVNGISILDSFDEMPILKHIFCTVSLVGIHVTKHCSLILKLTILLSQLHSQNCMKDWRPLIQIYFEHHTKFLMSSWICTTWDFWTLYSFTRGLWSYRRSLSK